jgi:hypothetical protein
MVINYSIKNFLSRNHNSMLISLLKRKITERRNFVVTMEVKERRDAFLLFFFSLFFWLSKVFLILFPFSYILILVYLFFFVIIGFSCGAVCVVVGS